MSINKIKVNRYGLTTTGSSPPPLLRVEIMHYLYFLKSKKDGRLYIGITNNLRRRIEEHNKCENKSTAHRGPF